MARGAHESLCSVMGLVSSGCDFFDQALRSAPENMYGLEELKMLRREVEESSKTWDNVYSLMKKGHASWPESCSFSPEEYQAFLDFYRTTIFSWNNPYGYPDIVQTLDLGLRMFSYCIDFCKRCLDYIDDQADMKLIEYMLFQETRRYDTVLEGVNHIIDLEQELEGHGHLILDGC